MGGRSSEHDISVASARSVVDALDPERYDVHAIEIGQDGRWHLEPVAEQGRIGEGGGALPVPPDTSSSPCGARKATAINSSTKRSKKAHLSS